MKPDADCVRFDALLIDPTPSRTPGPIFSATKGYQNFIRLNYGYPWSPSLDRAMKWLGQVAQSMC